MFSIKAIRKKLARLHVSIFLISLFCAHAHILPCLSSPLESVEITIVNYNESLPVQVISEFEDETTISSFDYNSNSNSSTEAQAQSNSTVPEESTGTAEPSPSTPRDREGKLLLTPFEDEDDELSAVDEIILDTSQGLKEKAIENLMKIFGIASTESILQRDEISSKLGPAPEFMIDLYNTITDSYGVTRARNPYNAHIVRSYIERDNSLNDFFFFNVSAGMSSTESVLEAELHIHRMRTAHEDLHPSLYLTPFYILSLYQVQDPKQLHIPDLHKLIAVNYVPALGSGWEVFNVKQAVLEWIKGERPNHGFLIAATSLSGDRVPVRFSRRGETKHHSKQPILVLFNQDTEMEQLFPTKPPIMVKVSRNGKKLPKHKSTTSTEAENETQSDENDEDNEELLQIPTSSLENPRFHHSLLYKDSIRHPNSVNRFRSRRSKNSTESGSQTSASSTSATNTTTDNDATSNTNSITHELTECGRQDLFVSFESIGWSSWIISPKGYNAFFCDGPCKFPLGQQVKPTNHATVQSIVYELKLANGVQRPCCVPTRLLPISLLFYDDHDNVVLKQYVDMVADSCGCH